MTKHLINNGSANNDGTGEAIRSAYGKVNANANATWDFMRLRPKVTGTDNWWPPVYVVSTGNSSIVANMIYFTPHLITWDGTITDVSINVLTGVASSSAKVAIYADAAGLPGARLLDCTASAPIDTSTSGIKKCSTGNSVSLAVSAGDIIWVGVVANGALGVMCIPNTTLMAFLPWDASWGKNNRLFSNTGSYAAGLPTDATTLAPGYSSSNSNPLSCLQFA